ncbi:MAG: UDP-N-acetylmuramoyl-L-alanine--D-glutamate ligase, partial [Clostridiales bacterium]|nr:UDP-N-acetylmuramoyl-L-alanine--D-glutamate ligase [Clostridiales bacterium]
LLVLSPGISIFDSVLDEAKACGVCIIGEIELGFLLCRRPIVAVTGTNGKTTVVKMIGRILQRAQLRAAVCGNVGVPFSRVAYEDDFDVAVVEVSSFQLESVHAFRPKVAVITNIAQDHLNRHKTMRTYIDAKLSIARNQTADDTLILSQDDIPLYALEGFFPRANLLYTTVRGALSGAYLLDGAVWFNGEEVCKQSQIRAENEHTLKNALSAVCACKTLGIENRAIIEGLSTFEQDAHRLHLSAQKGGKNFYNDSKGTNVSATLAAASCMKGRTCLIAGGSDKGDTYDELFKNLPQQIVRVAAIGAVANTLCAAAARCGFMNIKAFADLESAFAWASAGDEENVLLSPASASFDAYSSYAERGEAFERLVGAYHAQKQS